MDYSKNAYIIRGCILHCLHDPGEGDDPNALEVFEDGAMLVDGGKIAKLGPADEILASAGSDIRVIDKRGRIIVPGFIDVHIHYAQTDMIASYGEKLLEWLNNYTFPAEGRFADEAVAEDTASFFISELLRNGTTSAMVMGTVHKQSVPPLFRNAQQRGMRIAAGKVMMDQNAPDYLTDNPETSYRDTRDLIEQWHGVDRLSYAITPRFAPTSSEAQLREAGKLAQEYPDTYIHTHLSENPDEIAWVAELFPWSKGYLDVYDHFGLLRERGIYAHSIHLSKQERQRMAETGSVAVFCPTSNLFLGSGLFDYRATRDQEKVSVALGTDVGGGSSFSMIRTVRDAYGIAQLTDSSLSPARMLYLATLAGAESLKIDDKVGNFKEGNEADFLVLDPSATAILARRTSFAKTITEKLFTMLILGDDRLVESTWIYGKRQHTR